MNTYGLHVAQAIKDIQVSARKAERIGDGLAERGIDAAILTKAQEQLKSGVMPDVEADPEISGLIDSLAKTLAAVDTGKEFQNAILNAHAFTFEGGVPELLRETSAPDPEHLPFTHCYLDVEFDIPDADTTILGILVSETHGDLNLKTPSPALELAKSFMGIGQPPDDFFISALAIPSGGRRDNPLHFVCNYHRKVPVSDDTRTYGSKMVEAIGGARNRQRVEKALREFVAAWASMVLDPEVLIIESMKSPNARLKVMREHGAAPKSCRAIRLTGTLRRYVQATKAGWDEEARKGKQAHYVRGHIRHLTSERYTNKRGQTVWILPHVRGVGAVVRNTYTMEET